MYNILKNLINKKFYATAEIAQIKADVAWGMNKITDDEYSTLTMLVTEKYPTPVDPITQAPTETPALQ